MFVPHTKCRACEATGLVGYLDLGTQALANALRAPTDDTPECTAPLSVSWCSACGLSQLDQVVDPAILYRHYPFRAGLSRYWRTHVAQLVATLPRRGQGLLVDIGSNDGTLLETAQAQGWRAYGVDPDPSGPAPQIPELWSADVAAAICRDLGQVDAVTATNVFGHVDDAKAFLAAVAMVLHPSGQVIIEAPYILPLLEQTAFDTVYHEHLSYWSLRPLAKLAAAVGFQVTDVLVYPELHGGTMRYVLQPEDGQSASGAVRQYNHREGALFDEGIAPYRAFAERVTTNLGAFRALLSGLAEGGKRIWGYGASAKGNVLLQAAALPVGTIERMVDDTEAKWGYLTPGTRIPITAADDLSEPDILLLCSWNNAAEMKANARQRGFRGPFVLSYPSPHCEDA